jgi:hypothetical protein
VRSRTVSGSRCVGSTPCGFSACSTSGKPLSSFCIAVQISIYEIKPEIHTRKATATTTITHFFVAVFNFIAFATFSRNKSFLETDSTTIQQNRRTGKRRNAAHFRHGDESFFYKKVLVGDISQSVMSSRNNGIPHQKAERKRDERKHKATETRHRLRSIH